MPVGAGAASIAIRKLADGFMLLVAGLVMATVVDRVVGRVVIVLVL